VKAMCYNCYIMAESIPHRELRNNSSAILEQVRNGETFEITNRGEPVAILSPPDRAATERLRVRQATRSGSFAGIEGVVIEGRSEETLRDLRGER
jgi:prevent-host-death family protein